MNSKMKQSEINLGNTVASSMPDLHKHLVHAKVIENLRVRTLVNNMTQEAGCGIQAP